MLEDLSVGLQAYCARAFPARQAVRVMGLTRISAGWENEVYAFDLEHGPVEARQREELVLRIYPGDGARAKSAREFRGMQRLHQAGYPVPRVLALQQDGSLLGRPFVLMERVAGEVLWPLFFHSPDPRSGKLLTLFCDLFVRLHRLDWRLFLDAPLGGAEHPYRFVDEWLNGARAALAQFPGTGFSPIVDWLEARRDKVPCARPAPVHWDFHPGNILLRADGSAVVIDWTQLSVSDPRFDLSWTLLLVGSYEGATWRRHIQQEYERLAGARVERLEYFDVVACVKRLFSVTISLAQGPERLGMRPEAAAIMRQQRAAVEGVYGLLVERTAIRIPEVEAVLASLE